MKHVSSFFTKLFQACKLVPMLPVTVLAAIPVALLWNARPWKHFFWSVNPSIGQWIVIAMVVYTAFDSLKGMIEDIRKGYVGVDVLVIVAILSTIAVREYWAGWAIVLMVYSGETIEEYAQDKAKGNLTSLMEAAPVIAHVVNLPGIGSNAGHINGSGRQNTGDSGFRPVGEGEIQRIQSSSSHFETVPVDKVRMGDVLVVLPGETVPVDGELLSDSATLDLSNINGEPVPREVFAGARVLSGAVNGSSTLTMRATQLARDSQYQRILGLVSSAQSSRATVVRVADLLAVPFTVVAFLIAGFAWICSGVPMRFAQVLVIATPCPLLIAAPVAYIAGTGRLAKSGILIKTQEVLETLGRVSHIFFDKTGTLTVKKPQVVRVDIRGGSHTNGMTGDDGLDEDVILLSAGVLETYSVHILAQGIVNAGQDAVTRLAERYADSGRRLPGSDWDGHDIEHPVVKGVSEDSGKGLSGMVNGRMIRVGRYAYVTEGEHGVPTNPADVFTTPLAADEMATFVSINGRLAARIVMKDIPRANADRRQGGVRQHHRQGGRHQRRARRTVPRRQARRSKERIQGGGARTAVVGSAHSEADRRIDHPVHHHDGGRRRERRPRAGLRRHRHGNHRRHVHGRIRIGAGGHHERRYRLRTACDRDFAPHQAHHAAVRGRGPVAVDHRDAVRRIQPDSGGGWCLPAGGDRCGEHPVGAYRADRQGLSGISEPYRVILSRTE